MLEAPLQPENPVVLLIGNDPDLLFLRSAVLTAVGIRCLGVRNADQAVEVLGRVPCDLAIICCTLDEENRQQLLNFMLSSHSGVEVLWMVPGDDCSDAGFRTEVGDALEEQFAVPGGAALYFAVRSRRVTPTNSTSVRLLNSASGAFAVCRAPELEVSSDFAGDADIIPRPPKSCNLTIEAAGLPDDKRNSPASVETMGIQFSAPPRIWPTKITDWIVALSMVAIALACVYNVAALRKQPPARGVSASNPMNAAMTQGALGNDQRPWIGVLQTIPQSFTQTGGGFTIRLHNSGKSPAFEVRIRDRIRIEDLDEEPSVPVIDTAPAVAAGTLMPGAEFSTSARFRTSTATMAALQIGKVRAVNYLFVTYEDMTHRPHTTRQCFYWQVGLQSPEACGGYDQAE